MNTQPSVLAAGEPHLLDTALPEFRFSRLECAVIAAAPDVVYGAARDLDMLSKHSPLLEAATAGDQGDLEAQPRVALGERTGRKIVFGGGGKVRKPTIEWRRVEPGDYPGFEEPGGAKMAAAFVVHPYGARRSLQTYETRTACNRPGFHHAVRPLLDAGFPGVDIVLRGALRAIEAAAETEEGST
ncbi:hypothetical protein [Streptomyces sp. NPDC002463]|uniref:hypothetical protein n=1 Tax=Streptomyces sp. NPDC002463 TaxID=3364645 RepID=UPI00368EEECF